MGFYSSCVVLVAVYIIVKVSCECDKNCKDCKGSKCLECQSSYFPNKKGICQICTENCRTCLNETTCKTCVSGLFPHPNGQCEPCGENCFRCANETNCELCLTQFTLKNGRCTKCPDNCNKCDENIECLLCNTGFYFKNGRCEDCSLKCLRCSSYENCTECISGSWGPACNDPCSYVDYNMSKCKDGKCDQETGKCIECEEGTFGVMCENPCPSKCQKNICDINGKCSEGCLQGFYGDTCTNTCQDSVCAMNGNYTRGCNAGYYGMNCDRPCPESENSCVNFTCFRTNGTCIQECPHNCATCASQTNCDVCKNNFYGYMCENSCTNCIDNRCTLRECSLGCKGGYYNDRESCKSCRPNCSNCTSYDQCDTCLDGWYGPTCQLACDRISCSACEISFNNCTKCKPGYTLRNNTCCPGNCMSCNGDGRCLICEDGFYGVTCNRSCMDTCMGSSKGPLCDMENGQCLHGCEYGTWGQTCNRTCAKNCANGYCNSTTGHCLECKPTYVGLNCEKEAESKLISKNPMVPIIIVCIGICAVLCVVVVAVVIVRKKRSKRGDNERDITEKNVEMDDIGTAPVGARGRQRPASDDEVITENAMYEPFLPLKAGSETNAQNALLVNPGTSEEEEMANTYAYPAPNDLALGFCSPKEEIVKIVQVRGTDVQVKTDAVYALPIKDGSRA